MEIKTKDLSRQDLRNTDLTNTNLSGANLSGADLGNKERNDKVQKSIIKRALSEIDKQANLQNNDDDLFEIKLNSSQEKKLEELSEISGFSIESIVNFAIRYAIFYTQVENISLTELKDYPKRYGKITFEVYLTGKTLSRLKKSGLKDEVNQCLVVGIDLLYSRLIQIKKIKRKK